MVMFDLTVRLQQYDYRAVLEKQGR